LVIEGMEVEHAHIKLYPLYRIVKRVAEGTADQTDYQGFLTTLHGKRASETALARTAHRF